MGASLRGRPQRLWLLLALLAVLVAAGVVVALNSGGSAGSDHGRALALYGLQQRQTREKSGEAESEAGQRRGGESFGREENEGEGGKSEEGDGGEGLGDRSTREAAGVVEGRKGGEGERHGARTPWGEQVANRAYPRSYVDDKRALAGRRAFDRVRGAAPRTAFRSQREFDAARAAQPGRWTLLGPVTPNVAGEASQFFDPVTLQGPTTQESGRVAAIAVDPTCNADDGCRLWIATAGGGIWRTDDALAASVHWIPPSGDLPTNAFGSILYDAASDTLYAGSGEPNGSSDSEAGLGLFKSADGGATWSVVPGSRAVATNRSIGAIAVDPQDPDTIYIGTAVARHGSSSSNGGRRTPPGAPPLGVYKSTDGGATFTRLTDLATKTPADPTDPATGNDFFAGGVHRLEFDPNDPDSIYAGVLGYGVWRSADDGATWTQVFHTMNQNDFSDPNNPVGDSTGDITEFDLVDVSGTTRAYLGDASDDWAIDGDDNTPAPQVWRTDDVAAITGDPAGAFDNTGWTELSDETNGTNGFLAYNWCQNGQCSYDSFVASPPTQPDSVWLGGSMNYDELPAYAGQPPRSNGRAVIRSTNGGAAAPAVTWQDMSAALASDDAWDVSSGLHPDEQAIAFSDDGNVAFVGSDGGVARVDVTDTVDRSGSCSNRQYVYDDATGPEGLRPDDLLDCQRLLAAIPIGADQPNFVGPGIQPLNNGLADLQFQSLSFNPKNPERELLGGTQDNGTWSYTGSPAWFQSVGGDGGQSGFDADDPPIRYHNYFDATPEVNYHGNNPRTWLATYDPLQLAPENRSFYTPFIADPRVGGRIFTGLEHVWRSDDSGAPEAALVDKCNAMHLDPGRAGCGDWAALGPNLATEFNRATKNRGGQYVVATTRAPSDDITLWAGTRIGRVFVSKNADADASAVQFSRIDTLTSPGRFVSGIAVDPADANHAWISFSGYAAYTPGEPGHVFSVRFNPSTGSAAWTDITRNIGDQPVTSVAFDADTGDLYASTDFGVLRLPRGSSTWVEAAPGLPRVAVYGLSLSPQAHVLYAATHGRSAYAIRLRSRPSVSISGPSELRVGEPVTFSASGTASDGGALTFAWQLPGTPATATGSTATFRPTSRGAAVVRVTATDTHGLSRTAEKPVTISPRAGDSVKPRLSVGKVKTVRRPRSSAISGRVTDAGGVARLTVRFGDGTSRRVHVGRQGRFKVRHRYGAAGRYDVTVTAIDKAGNRRAVHRTARVLRRR